MQFFSIHYLFKIFIMILIKISNQMLLLVYLYKLYVKLLVILLLNIAKEKNAVLISLIC